MLAAAAGFVLNKLNACAPPATLLNGRRGGSKTLAAWLLGPKLDSVSGTRSSACWLSAAGRLAVA